MWIVKIMLVIIIPFMKMTCIYILGLIAHVVLLIKWLKVMRYVMMIQEMVQEVGEGIYLRMMEGFLSM